MHSILNLMPILSMCSTAGEKSQPNLSTRASLHLYVRWCACVACSFFVHVYSASYNVCVSVGGYVYVYVYVRICALPKHRHGMCSFSLFRCPYGGQNSWPRSPEHKSALIALTEGKYVAAAFGRGAYKTLPSLLFTRGFPLPLPPLQLFESPLFMP